MRKSSMERAAEQSALRLLSAFCMTSNKEQLAAAGLTTDLAAYSDP